MDEHPKSKTDEFFENLFLVEKSHKLEKKAWFRLLKLLQGLIIVIIVLITLVSIYFLFTSKTQIAATLSCNDGTTWNAMDPNWKTLELNNDKKCGLCTRRTVNNTYASCDYGDPGYYNSYTVINAQYEQTYNITQYLLYPLIGMFIFLTIVKLLVKGIVYVLVGRE